MINVFIIGSKGIPAKYGGFETFVENLTEKKVNSKIKYHVSCLADNTNEFFINETRCFNVKVPNIGSSKAILYDILSLYSCIKYIRENNLKHCIVYILACRIGPFFRYPKIELEKMGVKVLVNPDGHEWKRSKWSLPVRKYWKYSEKKMVEYADYLICDSKGIQNYILKEYSYYKPRTDFISYGADVKKSVITNDNPKLLSWFNQNNIKEKGYYLIVGRFVPENNYETMIKEFIKSSTDKDLVIITNVDKDSKLYKKVIEINFEDDPRIKFVGTLYDQELLKKIRELSFGYLHGHEVGGTNPSLLEALASTDLNLLLDVPFNREVGEESCYYFTKDNSSLSNLIDEVDKIALEERINLGYKAKNRIIEDYSWKKIVEEYELFFLNIGKDEITL